MSNLKSELTEMVHSSYHVFLLTLGFSLQLAWKVTMATQDENIAPLPTNIKVNIYPGVINVTWDCNITKSMENYTYKIKFNENTLEPLHLPNCSYEYEMSQHLKFILRKGVSINIASQQSDDKFVKNNWKEVILTPEGKNNTAAEKFFCVNYNVSVMNCLWSVGKDAPEDTQYSVEFRQVDKVAKCEDYRKDSFGRQVGCVLKSPNIPFDSDAYILVVGSSNQTSIQFFDDLNKLNNYDENIAPLPTSLKVNLYPGVINVTWDCKITKSMENYTYKINFNRSRWDTLHLPNCFKEYTALHLYVILHEGVSIDIESLKFGNTHVPNKWKPVILTPEGKNNTGAKEFLCIISNVSVMNCLWRVGKDAPEDTQYSVEFRQQNTVVKCEDYRKDSFGRQVGCVLKSPNISFSFITYILVVGSSNQTSIQFFDVRTSLNNYVYLDPPRNIHLSYNSDELEIKWEQPETYKNNRDGTTCFTYNIYFKEKGVDENITNGYSYKTNQFPSNEKITVTMRVKWVPSCSKNMKWSKWSEPHIHGFNTAPFSRNHLLIVIGIGTAVILILLIFLCHRFSIWTKLFPQVPTPAIKMLDKVEQEEISVQKLSEIEFLLVKPDEEECICAYVTEVSQKPQSESVTGI